MALHSGSWSNSSDLNSALNKYFHANVQISRDSASKAVQVVIPIVREILTEVNKQDSRFDHQPRQAGSYSQGLKVKRADEFDVNVICSISGLSWEDLTSKRSRYYEFSDSPGDADPVTSFPEDRRVIISPGKKKKKKGLRKVPPTGCCFVSLERIRDYNPEWRFRNRKSKKRVLFDNDVIPYLVKKRFKTLLTEAITKLRLPEGGLVRQVKPHGPALTIRIRDIDVDFAPLIEAGLPVPSWINWPRPSSKWPSWNKIEKVKAVGINLVPKKNFYWMLSFGKMEEELMDGIDEGGGCRKQVHRLTKKMLNDIWCPTTKPVISSYHLKNVLFWECEDHPSSSSWEGEHLSERFQGVVDRLRDALRKRHLPLYFYPDVNLFLEKSIEELDLVGRNIDSFKSDPVKYLEE